LPAALVLLVAASCNASVNRSLTVGEGEKHGGMNTVNGSIRVGEDAEVDGSCATVNGQIRVGEGSRVEDLSSVNGSIDVAGKVTVAGDVESVNGSVEVGAGSEIRGDVGTVNGGIRLEGVVVTGKVSTYNGGVTLREGTRVARDVVIERTRGSSDRRHSLDVKILGGSVVEGDVIVEDSKRKVTVYLEGGGEVKGEIRGAEVVRR
jgi:DUF4097 and DUF4098 domain-containing protein YvlB